MGRSRVVQPGVVRLFIADVYRRELVALEARRLPKKATKQELQAAKDAIADADADGEWIDVKAELSAGEARAAADAMRDRERERQSGGARMVVDPIKVGPAKVLAFALSWSFVDGQGDEIPVTPDGLDSFDLETYQEIEAAVLWHEEQIEKARIERKNARATARALPATSGSHSVPAGPSSASAH